MVHECGYRQRVAVHPAHGVEDRLDHFHGLFPALVVLCRLRILGGSPRCGDLHLLKRRCACVYRCVVHVYDVLSLLQVRRRRLLLHVPDGVLLRDDLRQREKRRLQNGIRPLAHADLLRKVDRIYHVKLDVIVCYVALGRSVKMMLKLLKAPLAVYEEHAAGLYVTHDGEALRDVRRNVARHKVRLVYIVRTLYLLVAEAQVRNRYAARLLRVVLEVCLYVLVRMVADDLDRVLVCSDGAVAAESPELALHGAFRRRGRYRLLRQRQSRHVVHDADGELALGFLL